MKARIPRIDYSQVRARWAPNREFTHNANASSTIPAFVEPWLIKVMNRIKLVLPASETRLHREIDIFIAQEAQHYRQHAAFNRRVREEYPAIAQHEQRIEREYQEMLDHRSLKYCLAYSEGFEALGSLGAVMWFDKYRPYLEGADYEAVAMWKWHMAEEYEHREVCFQLFRALYARTLWGRFWNGWIYRCYGFVCALRHLGSYTNRVANEMLEADRRSMGPAELERSKASLKQFQAHTRTTAGAEILKVFSPFYNPSRRPEPEGMADYLKRFEKGGDMGREAVA